MTQHIVTAAAVVLPLEGGSERYLYRGAPVGEGYTEAGIQHALAVGLIAVVPQSKVDRDLELAQAAKAEDDARIEASRAAEAKRVEDVKKAEALKTSPAKSAAPAAKP